MPWGLAAAAGASIIGGALASNASSEDASKRQDYAEKNSFMNSGLYNANAFNLNGDANFAANQANAYEQAGNSAMNRQAPLTDYSVAHAYGTMGDQDAASMRGLAGQLSDVASGKTTTVAQQQAALQSQQLVQQQASQAASARGAAGLALAGQQAATNTANGQASISQQAQVNAAQERMGAANAAAGMYGGLRSGDLAAQQQQASQAQYTSGLAMQQRNANDSFQIAQQQNAINTRNTQLQANIAQQQFVANEHDTTVNQALGIQAQNAQRQQQVVNGVVQGVSNAATSAAARAEGGPVAAGQPYLVGEKGPEMVVPRYDGLVIPAGPTAEMTGDASGLVAAMQDPQKASAIKAAQQNPMIGLHLRQQAMNDPVIAAKVRADPALMAIALGKV